ncbi:UNVERIFIED_CONTAM: hypothetical protein NCL1_45131 [Trichonephila clavipes]
MFWLHVLYSTENDVKRPIPSIPLPLREKLDALRVFALRPVLRPLSCTLIMEFFVYETFSLCDRKNCLENFNLSPRLRTKIDNS